MITKHIINYKDNRWRGVKISKDWEDLLSTPEEIESRRKTRSKPAIFKKVNSGEE